MLRAGTSHPDADEQMAASRDHDDARLYATLNEYLLMEHKYQPKLRLPVESENGEVTTGARDGAAHVLRCLKMWFDLPADVLIDAINLFDRFLTKMKVRPCHVPCITVSCMNIAIEEYATRTNMKRNVSIEELVSISQSACTAGDVSRMSRIVVDKLGLGGGGGGGESITALHWLRLLRALLLMHLPEQDLLAEETELVNLLEIVSCDATCANTRASELALVLLFHELEKQLVERSEKGLPVPESVYYLYNFARQLQIHCHMSDASLSTARARVVEVSAQYEGRRALPQRQRLVWRLSERTLKVLRPTDRLTSLLPTIQEQHTSTSEHSPPPATTRNRSGSESSENEETSDWPRSPVLPVYCGN